MARGNRPQVVLVHGLRASAGVSRLPPRAAVRVGPQKFGYIGDRPIRIERAAFGAWRSDWRPGHDFDDLTSAQARRTTRGKRVAPRRGKVLYRWVSVNLRYQYSRIVGY